MLRHSGHIDCDADRDHKKYRNPVMKTSFALLLLHGDRGRRCRRDNRRVFADSRRFIKLIAFNLSLKNLFRCREERNIRSCELFHNFSSFQFAYLARFVVSVVVKTWARKFHRTKNFHPASG